MRTFTLSRDMLNILLRYPWPGNVRELQRRPRAPLEGDRDGHGNQQHHAGAPRLKFIHAAVEERLAPV